MKHPANGKYKVRFTQKMRERIAELSGRITKTSVDRPVGRPDDLLEIDYCASEILRLLKIVK